MAIRDDAAATATRIWSLYAALTLMALGTGLQGTLVGVRTQSESFSALVTGLVMASYYAGFLGGSFVAPRFVLNVGHIRVFAALASTASIAALIYSLSADAVTYAGMRFVTGACLAGLYVVAESWINTQATNATRGRLLGLYMVVLMGGAGVGQFLLNLSDPDGFELFILSSVLISVAVVPVSLARSPAPHFEVQHPTGFRTLLSRAPLGVVAGLLTGAATGAVLGMGAVYATQAGLDTGQITVFMAAALFGGMAFQWPLGRLSDRLPRRRVILVTAVVAVAIALVATMVPPTGALMPFVSLGYGGLAFTMYSLAISLINDVTPVEEFVGSAAVFLFFSGLGAIAGPLIAAGALEVLGPEGYWWSLAAFYAPVALLAVYRIVSQSAIVESRRYAPIYRPTPVLGAVIEDSPDEPTNSPRAAR